MHRNLNRSLIAAIALPVSLGLVACSESGTEPAGAHDHAGDDHSGHDHDHDDHAGHDHGDHDQDHAEDGMHDHEAHPLGTAMIGQTQIEADQSHGILEAGKEMHLIVRIPGGSGSEIVRAWIGTEDRFESVVALAEHDADDAKHDVHVEAPDPLPAGAAWWIEIEHADGTKEVGSIAARTE